MTINIQKKICNHTFQGSNIRLDTQRVFDILCRNLFFLEQNAVMLVPTLNLYLYEHRAGFFKSSSIKEYHFYCGICYNPVNINKRICVLPYFEVYHIMKNYKKQCNRSGN